MPIIDDVLSLAANTTLSRVSTALSTAVGLSARSTPQNRLLPEYALTISCPEKNIYFTAPLPPEFDWAVSAEYDTPVRDLISDTVASAGIVGRVASTAARANGIQMVTQALTAKFWTGSSTGAFSIPVVLQAYSDEVIDVLQPLVSLKALSLPSLAGGKRGSVLSAPGPHFDLNKAYENASNAIGTQVNTKSVAGKNTSTGSTDSMFGNLGRLFSPLTDQVSGVLRGDVNAASAVVDGAYAVGSAADSYLKSSVRNNVTVQIGNYIRLPSVVIKDVQSRHSVQPVAGIGGGSTGNMQRVEVTISFEPFFDLTFEDLADVFLDARVAAYVRSLCANGSSYNYRGTVLPNSLRGGA